MVKFQTYSINQLLLTNQLLESYIINFWNDIFLSIKDNKHLMLMCKVEFSENELGYRTLGELRRVNFDDRELFIEYITARLGLLNESYTTHPISKLTFSYFIKSGLATDNRRLLKDLTNKSITVHRFNNMNLPISMNPSDYGNILVDNFIQINGKSLHRFIADSGIRSYILDISADGLTNNVRIQGATDLSWIDTKISDDLFSREIGKSVIYFMGGEKVLRKKLLNAKPFKKLGTDSVLNSNFVTMDIETITLNNKITPYLMCAYGPVVTGEANTNVFIESYANSTLDQKELFTSFIYKLLTFFNKKSKVLTVYAHNLSGFDGIFLLKQLFTFGKVEPLLFNGKLMSIKIKLNVPGSIGKTIIFKDSYLLLPLSLRNLCKAFSVIIPKGHFPFLLNDIFYKGVLPKLSYWTGISVQEFESLSKEFLGVTWSFKDEAIKYCKLDCQCLHEILTKFNELIFNHFKININLSLTLPALAMRIFKTHYMLENSIYQLLGNVERDIRESYTGGAVDVYIPHNRKESFFNKIFTKLYYYDVNSLYPFVMANTPMPVGRPVAFSGNIRKVDLKIS